MNLTVGVIQKDFSCDILNGENHFKIIYVGGTVTLCHSSFLSISPYRLHAICKLFSFISWLTSECRKTVDWHSKARKILKFKQESERLKRKKT